MENEGLYFRIRCPHCGMDLIIRKQFMRNERVYKHGYLKEMYASTVGTGMCESLEDEADIVYGCGGSLMIKKDGEIVKL